MGALEVRAKEAEARLGQLIELHSQLIAAHVLVQYSVIVVVIALLGFCGGLLAAWCISGQSRAVQITEIRNAGQVSSIQSKEEIQEVDSRATRKAISAPLP